jgi:hypothetical protein
MGLPCISEVVGLPPFLFLLCSPLPRVHNHRIPLRSAAHGVGGAPKRATDLNPLFTSSSTPLSRPPPHRCCSPCSSASISSRRMHCSSSRWSRRHCSSHGGASQSLPPHSAPPPREGQMSVCRGESSVLIWRISATVVTPLSSPASYHGRCCGRSPSSSAPLWPP